MTALSTPRAPSAAGPAARPRPVACLCGPTASGKTALALEIAASLPGRIEIVSVDSALVYRGMDIGTAKPTPAERAAVPHHLIDLRDPWEPYSAAEFAADAHRCIAEIRARGREPLLVGGTMLYFKALFEGLDALPPTEPAVRAALAAEAAERGWPALHADLMAVDPDTARRLAPADAQRISRALEVWHQTGQTISSMQRRHRGPAAHGAPPADGPRYVSLEPEDRAWLHERIARRVDAMLEAGLLEEVRRLATDPRVHAGLPALRAVGYRQCWEALAADPSLGAPGALAGLRDRCIAATRQLAKRQLTWLRSLSGRRAIPWNETSSRKMPIGEVLSYLFTPPGGRPPERGMPEFPRDS